MIMNKEDLSFIKESISFWKEITEEQKQLLSNFIVKKNFAKGDIMPAVADNCSGLFLIYSGQIRAYIISESGKEITLYRLFERDICIFSASCIMKNISFDIYIEIEKDTQAFLIPTSIYRRLSEESLPVQVFTNQLMASRFSDVMWIMEQALFTSFDKRLASFLLEQSVIEESNFLAITHERIANHLGTAREVVTRMLRYFQNEGMVLLTRGTIELTNHNKLRALVKD